MINLVSFFKSYLSEDAYYNFLNNMLEESKYCSDLMRKHFKKELVMTKKDDDDFENSTKYQICDNVYVDGDVKVRDHCYITGKYRVSTPRDCNIKVKFNHKVVIVLHNLKIMMYILLLRKTRKIRF